jgi:hypothetical protein
MRDMKILDAGEASSHLVYTCLVAAAASTIGEEPGFSPDGSAPPAWRPRPAADSQLNGPLTGVKSTFSRIVKFDV